MLKTTATNISTADLIKHTDEVLDSRLPAAQTAPTRLHQAMRYAVLNPGKRLRPLCVYLTALTFGTELTLCDNAAAAVELIHAYSLIHDDLPAMDDDDLRRGRPTCHIAFDEATAILAGDALQSLAFYLLTDYQYCCDDPRVALQLIRRLGQATGSFGMAGGQMFDIQSSTMIKTEADLAQLHRMKTGALITASMMMGVDLSTHVDEAARDIIVKFSDSVGLGFQIQDDILDVEASTDELGKSTGNDSRHQKITYPSLLGLAGAKSRVESLLQQALALLSQLPVDTSLLSDLTHQLLQRRK